MLESTTLLTNKWQLTDVQSPLLTVQSTTFFRQEICFQVIAINGNSMEVYTNQAISELTLKKDYSGYFEFPRVGTIVRPIQFILQKASDFSTFTIKVSTNQSFKDLLATYLFRFLPNANLEILKQQGLKLKSIRNLVDYGFVENKTDMAEVAELRRMTYGKTDKVNAQTKFTDAFDEKSKILIVRHHQRIIASVRIFYPTSKNEPLEHQQYDIDFPSNFPTNTEIAEMMRLCTHEAYRKSDLLLGILEFAAIDILQENRKYVLGCAEKKLLPLYLKLGFRNTRITYPNSSLNNMLHHVILMDIEAIGKAKMNPIAWNMIWGETAQFAQEQDLLNLNRWFTCKVNFYHLIRPVTNWIYRHFVKR